MKRVNKTRQNGYTLVEVIVALAIFAIIAIFAYPAIASAMNANNGAYQITQAQEVSQNYLENVVNQASLVKTNDALITNLKKQTQYGSISYNTSSRVLELTAPDYTLKMTFSNVDNTVRVQTTMKKSNVHFETVEWLVYEK